MDCATMAVPATPTTPNTTNTVVEEGVHTIIELIVFLHELAGSDEDAADRKSDYGDCDGYDDEEEGEEEEEKEEEGD